MTTCRITHKLPTDVGLSGVTTDSIFCKILCQEQVAKPSCDVKDCVLAEGVTHPGQWNLSVCICHHSYCPIVLLNNISVAITSHCHQNSHICSRVVTIISHGKENFKTGQAGGLPSLCCDAPDLLIVKRVMNEL